MFHKKIFCLVGLFLLASCISDGIKPPKNYPYPELAKRHPPKYRFIFSAPSKWELLNRAPDGPYGFRVGWRDGCDTSVGMWIRNPYRGFIKPRKDYVFMQKDGDYSSGYGLGYWFCSRYSEINARTD